jgi:hypothetical protein
MMISEPLFSIRERFRTQSRIANAIKTRSRGGTRKMLYTLLLILAGMAAGSALFFPVQFLCAYLLRRRGLETATGRKQQWVLLGCMAAAGG